MADVLTRITPHLANAETQAFIFAALSFIGSWVLLTKIIQLAFSILWPVILIGAFLTLAPQWTNVVVSEYIPQYMQILQEHFRKLAQRFAGRRIKE